MIHFFGSPPCARAEAGNADTIALVSGSEGARPKARNARTVTVRVAADMSLRTNEVWKVDITRIFMDVSQTFEETVGVKFRIKSYDYWNADPTAAPGGRAGQPLHRSLRSLLPALQEHVGRTGRGGSAGRLPVPGDGRASFDIVVGLVPEGPDGPVNPGIADYLNGIVIIKYLEAKGGLNYVLLHELCHLFGAIDLREEDSVMSYRSPAFRIDDFTRAIMRVNRERSFRPGECPLPEDRILEAIALYDGRRARGLGEDEIQICLGTLRALMVTLR